MITAAKGIGNIGRGVVGIECAPINIVKAFKHGETYSQATSAREHRVRNIVTCAARMTMVPQVGYSLRRPVQRRVGFRDDNASRRAKLDALIAERGEHEERIDVLEERLSALEARVAEQEAAPKEEKNPEITRAKKSGSKKSDSKKRSSKKSAMSEADVSVEQFARRWRAAFGVAGVVIVGCFVGMFWPKDTTSVEEPVRLEHMDAPSDVVCEPAVDIADLQETTERSIQLQATEPVQPATPRPLFTGRVTLVEGSTQVEPGMTCEVHASAINGLRYRRPPENLRIRCGDEELYSIETTAPCGVRGQGEDFGGLFTFDCEDRGIRGDRPELELRSVDRHLRVWSELHGWSVTIALDRAAARVTLSRPYDRRGGLPAAPSSLTLRVQGRLGERAPPNNAILTLEITPLDRLGANCEFVVREGSQVIGNSDGLCILDSQLQHIGIEAPLSERRPFGITRERNEDFITIESADGDHTWRIQTIIEAE